MPDLTNSGVPADQLAVLLGIYRESAAKLRAIVMKPGGTTEGARLFNAARASEQLAQVERLIGELRARASAWVGDKRDGSRGPVSKAVRDGILRADQQAKDAGVRTDGAAGGSFSLIDRRTSEFFAREIAIDLNKAAGSMGETAKKVLRTTAQQGLSEAEINKVLAGGVIAGKPVETIRQLREALKAVHGEQVIIQGKGGPISFDVGYYASMVARTQTRMATVHARHERLRELDIDLVAIIGLPSKNFCTAFLGQVFSLDGKGGKYPALSSLPGGGPPFHPNCSKSTRPYIESLASATQRDQADGVDDSAKLLNTTPAEAQKRFNDLQIYSQVKGNYATTAKQLYEKSAA